jgi:predicted nucleic acid-binding Zn ribbon protein
MGRSLFSLGSFLLVATVFLWIAGAAGWMSDHASDVSSAISLKAGIVLMVASLILRLVSPVAKQITKSHCAACGRPVAKGHIYCNDHLQETVNQTRDRTHGSSQGGMRRRA